MKSLAKLFGIGSDKSEPTDQSTATIEKNTIVEETANDAPKQESGNQQNVRQLPIDAITANPFQPRKTFNDEGLRDLAASIQEFGVIQPLLVRVVEDRYELVAGERRLRASKIAGLKEVPAILKELNDKEMAEIAMIENLQREDLHFLEEAEGFHQLLINFGFTQDELAKRMGKSQSTIANKLRILKLGEAVRNFLYEAQLTERHARALLKLPQEEKQLEVLATIKEKGLNVRESELLIQEILDEISQEINEKSPKQNVVRVVRDVRIFLNTINQVVGEMKKSGLKVKVKQEQDEENIIVKMVIPTRKK